MYMLLVQPAFAAIELVGTTTASGTNVAYDMALDSLQGGIASAPAQDDIVIVVNTIANATDGNPGVGTAGYTEIKDAFNGVDTNKTNLSVNYKIMTASPDTTVSCNPSSGTTISSVCLAMVFRGVDILNPMDTASTSAASTLNTSEDVDCPSIQPVTSGAFVVCTGGAAGANTQGYTSGPASYIDAAHILTPTDIGTDAAAVGSYLLWDDVGAENPGAYSFDLGTAGANTWIGVTMVLRPYIPPIVAPTVSTNFANAGATTATLNGTKTGGTDTVQYGFAYSTDSTLGTGAATSALGVLSSNSSFSDYIGGLNENTTYWFRAYASNTAGTAYGIIRSFVTGNSVPKRTMRLFEGFRIKLISGRMILYQSQ